MNKDLIYKLNKILTVIAATFLCIFIAGLDIAVSNSAIINYNLGIKTYKIVKGDDNDEDTEYFSTDYKDDLDGLNTYVEAVCKEVEGEGLVLLRNDNNALPLPTNAKVSCFAQGSVILNYNTSGSSSTSVTGFPTLKEALEQNSFAVNSALWDRYDTLTTRASEPRRRRLSNFIYKTNEAFWSEVTESAEVVNSFSQYGDAAIVVFARNSGEGVDISTIDSDGEKGDYLSISPNEETLLKELTALKKNGTFARIIMLLNYAVPMELDFLFRDDIDVDACLWIGNLGKTGVYAVAEALSGKIAPSGRLSDTFCRNNFSSPAMAYWALNSNKSFAQRYSNYNNYVPNDNTLKSMIPLNTTQRYYGIYVEGIYVGYRYYETRYEDKVLGTQGAGNYDYWKDVAYPFGYGISYTDFAYSDYAVTENSDDTFTVSVKVTNTGEQYTSKEVVQIYLQKPYDAVYDNANGIGKAAVELVGFAKTGKLQPGAAEVVTVKVDKEMFKSYDSQGNKTYILSKGKYYLAVGKNAHDALNNILVAKEKTGMDAPGNAQHTKMVWDNLALDAVKYSKSIETGKPITNQLDFIDINRYTNKGANSINYVSRSNWMGTWPTQSVALSVANDDMFSI